MTEPRCNIVVSELQKVHEDHECFNKYGHECEPADCTLCSQCCWQKLSLKQKQLANAIANRYDLQNWIVTESKDRHAFCMMLVNEEEERTMWPCVAVCECQRKLSDHWYYNYCLKNKRSKLPHCAYNYGADH